jgi:iron complex transport system substrate-binding protein
MFRNLRHKFAPLAICLLVALAACAPAASNLATAVPPTTLPTATRVPATATSAATATTAPTATQAPITITDYLGRELTLAAPAAKIVSLAPSNTEILFAIGAGDRLIGRDDFSDFPAEAAAIPSVGSLYPSVNAEAIVALQPDLVLAAGITNPDDIKHLADLGLTVYATSIAKTLDDIYNDINAVGTLTGQSEQAASLVADMKTRVDAVAAKTNAMTVKPIVFYELDATEPSKPWTAGPGTFIDQMISLAGGTNAGNIASSDYAQLSLEQLVAQNPDIIVLGSATFGGQTPELVAARPGWGDIKAVKDNAVYTFDDNLVSRPGPRVVDGLEQLAKLIHPELFK